MSPAPEAQFVIEQICPAACYRGLWTSGSAFLPACVWVFLDTEE
jgi:hypothetical protein